ncbi:MAG: hypothetical protein ISS72_08215 [Candidatus Brocadiae bacterium]|nr:hypothetical protein [Candidatus Brocadiia bacterium]
MRRVVLGAAMVLGAWSFVPVLVAPKPALVYNALGIVFHFDRSMRVRAISIQSELREFSVPELPPLERARGTKTTANGGCGSVRPGEHDVLPDGNHLSGVLSGVLTEDGKLVLLGESVLLDQQDIPLPGSRDVADPGSPSGTSRPPANRIAPGMGCCGIVLGDLEKAVAKLHGVPTRRLRFGRLVQLEYPELLVVLHKGRVAVVHLCKQHAVTAEGIRIGSARKQVIRAYGFPGVGRTLHPGDGGAVVAAGSEENYVMGGSGWLGVVSGSVFRGLVIALVLCICLRCAVSWHICTVLPLAAMATLGGHFLTSAIRVSVWMSPWWLCPWLFTREQLLRAICALVAVLAMLIWSRLLARPRLAVASSRFIMSAFGAAGLATAVGAVGELAGWGGSQAAVFDQTPLALRVLRSHTVPSGIVIVCLAVVASQARSWWEATFPCGSGGTIRGF